VPLPKHGQPGLLVGTVAIVKESSLPAGDVLYNMFRSFIHTIE
jgi:hypothetical protein